MTLMTNCDNCGMFKEVRLTTIKKKSVALCNRCWNNEITFYNVWTIFLQILWFIPEWKLEDEMKEI